MPSFAQKYQAAKDRTEHQRSPLGRFEAAQQFALDGFQAEACQALQEGHGVLVAAPTGAGKTVVGEFAIHLAREEGTKAFYTTPIKALSNQKYKDFVADFGVENVGLLTGDLSVNSEAPIVVMTTEVLRNMLYARSSTLRGLGYVVMDEVHYLADRFRGPVWEEVIIHLPESVQLVSLSATVSNTEEFGRWLDTVRGSTRVVVSETRPVPLWQHVLVGQRMFDLFPGDTTVARAADILRQDGGKEKLQVNKDLLQATARRGGPRGRGGRGQRSGARIRRPSRPQTVRVLDEAALLPAICFIFSRAACDDAVSQCIDADIRLNDYEQAKTVRAYVAEATAEVPLKDLRVLGFDEWREGLARGVAAHHAGMLPLFKEIVEHLFSLGLLKVVFATETLALGINMPARSVVLEKLTKFNGEQHVDVTPGEYTQLTGRAGRRGIDVEGHAVVLWNEGMDARAVAGLASRRTYPLHSSFRPTYNMSVNLLDQFGAERAMGVMESSFAQFQADKSVVALASRARKQENALQGYEEAMDCHLGDYAEYARLRYALNQEQKKAKQQRRHARQGFAEELLQALRAGDVLVVPHGRSAGPVVVVGAASAGQEPRVPVVTLSGQVRTLAPADLDEESLPVSRAKVPKHFTGRTAQERKDMASRLRSAMDSDRAPRELGPLRAAGSSAVREPDQLAELRARMTAHPCHGCSEMSQHDRWYNRWVKLRREHEQLRHQIDARTNTIAQRFGHILELLESYGYVDQDHSGPRLTAVGQPLKKIYGERDLLASLTLQAGCFEDLDPAALCAAVSALVFEGKRDETPSLRKYPADLGDRVQQMHLLAQELNVRERRHRLPETPAPDLGIMWAVYRWARGENLARSLEGTALAGGDFVRCTKQIIDALDQLGRATEDPLWRTACERAMDLVRRGVVVHELGAPEEAADHAPEALSAAEDRELLDDPAHDGDALDPFEPSEEDA